MKKLIAIAALATAAVAAPASAGTLAGEVRFSDVRNGQADSTEYKVEYWDSILNGTLNLGAELQTKQAENAGAVRSAVSLKAGLNGPAALGIHTLAYGEVGQALRVGDNAQFWGLGIKGSRQLVGPVSVNAGYRHRQGFEGHDGFNEERLHAGLGLALTDNTSVGATYYRTRGTANSDAVGVSVTRKF